MRELAASRFGGQEIGTPHLYRWAAGAPLHELADAFENRLFIAREGDEAHVLRYGGDPGFFDYAATLGLRAADLPVRMWEFGPAWRRSRSGELRGIERLHEFRFLDHHTICRRGDALDEYERRSCT